MAIVGVASVRIKPDLTTFRKELQAGLSEIKASVEVAVHANTLEATAEIDKWRKEQEAKPAIKQKVDIDSLSVTKAGKALDGLASSLARAGIGALALTAATAAAQALVPLLVSASAVALLIPGALLAGAAAAVTLKLGAAGIKKAFDALTPTLNNLKAAVSQTFVTDLGPAVKNLKALIPQLTPGFKGVAAAISGVAVSFTAMLKSGSNVSILQGLLKSTATIITNIGKALAPIGSAFLQIAGTAAGMLGDLTSGFGAAATSFNAFITNAANTGKLFDWIQGGISALHQIGAILVQVGAIFGAVFSGISKGAGNLGGTLLPTLKAINTALSNPAGQAALQALGRAFSQVGQAVGAELTQALQVLLPLITSVLTFIGNHATLVVNLGIAIFGLVKGIAIASAAMKAWTVVAGALDIALDANPIGAVVLAIAALITVAILVIANWSKVSAFFSNLGQGIAKIWDNVTGAIGDAFSKVVDFITGIFSGIGSFFSGIGDKIVSAFDSVVSFFQGLPGKIGSFLAALPGVLGNAFLVALKFAANAVLQGIEWILAEIIALPFQIGFLLSKLSSIVINAFTSAWNALVAWLPGAITTVIVFFQDLPGKIVDAVGAFGSMIINWFQTTWNDLVLYVAGVIPVLIAYFQALPGRIISSVANFAAGIVAWFKNAWNNLVNATAQSLPGIINFFQSIPGKILGALGDFGNMLLNAGKAIIQGLVNGIKAGAKWVTDALGDILAKARSLLPFSPARTGPFSGRGWTLYSGMSISQALADGITASGGKAVQATEDLMNSISDTTNATGIGSALSGAFSGAISASGAVDFTPTPVVVNVTADPDKIQNFIQVQIDNGNRQTRRSVMAGIGGTTT